MSDDIQQILGPDGLLSKHLPGYEPRPQQVSMAETIQETFRTEGRLAIEAATGTGKTLAYLIPALLSGKCVIVSTATKALQEQIFLKDVPFLKKLFKHTKPKRSFRAVNIKGRTNYLCKHRFETQKDTVRLKSRKDVRLFHKINLWSIKTKTGDRSEISGLPDDYAPWSQITATGQQCHGSDCEHFEDCYVTKVRREAKEANLIVVNHHLFFADLALRSSGVTAILPDYDAIVFDEAHHLEETMTSYFGTEVSSWRLLELTADVTRTLSSADSLTSIAEKRIQSIDELSEDFMTTLDVREGRYPLEPFVNGPHKEAIQKGLDELLEGLSNFADFLETVDAGDANERLFERCNELIAELKIIMRCDEAGFAYIVERRGRGVFLSAEPIDVAKVFRSKVFNVEGAQIYTSATLSVGESFDYFLGRLGLKDEPTVKTLKLPPVFDYENRTLVYIPRRLPAPTHPDWIEGACQIIDYLVKSNEGRAFVLFTSYRNMERAYEALADDLPFLLLKQGQAPKRELLEQFKEDISSVLFATHSFWEGVDVEGEALSLVIIDKLPFANPKDPLVAARLKMLDDQGGNAFVTYSIPSAAISLKQGFGRLIRSHKDTGVVAILDSRIHSKRYGRTFLEALPPAPVVWNARDVRDWWKVRPD